MTAPDELRRLLNKHGMEWDYGITGSTTTKFSVNGIDLTFTPMRDGLVCSTILTPEQVISVTLGTGTCHNKGYIYCHERYFVCSNCGCEFDYSNFAYEFAEHRSLGSPHYCPNCGAKVVD